MKITKLNLKLALIGVFFVSGLSQVAYGQGDKIGNGGKGVLCGKNLRVLDLYESEEVYHHQTSAKYSNLDENLKNYGLLAMQYLSSDPVSHDTDVLVEIKKNIMDLIIDIPAGESLPLSNDATLPKIPRGCSVVQIATYLDSTNIIKRDRNLWDMLNSQNQAALILHEAVYKMSREVHATTSDHTRLFIGELFSDLIKGSKFDEVQNAKRVIWCGAGISHSPAKIFDFYLVESIQNGQPGLYAYFTVMNDNFELLKSDSFIPITLESFLKGEYFPIQTLVSRGSVASSTNLKLYPKKLSSDGTVAMALFEIQAWNDQEQPPVVSSGFCQFIKN